MNSFKKILLFSGVLFCFSAANADSTPPRNGIWLLHNCQAEISMADQKITPNYWQDLNSDGICTGYIMALNDWNDAFLSNWKDKTNIANNPGLFCLSSSVTIEQAARVIIRYLENHPEQLNESSLMLTLSSLHQTWPCKNET